MRQPRHHTRREAFTLIELLVVIAIIAVLVALTAAGVMRFIVKGPEIQARTEIGDMETAIRAFQDDHNRVTWLPSRLKLYEDVSNPAFPTDAFGVESRAWLKQAFGKRLGPQIDWNNDGTINGPHILEGHECLVFLLGGIPTPPAQAPGCLGFSNNPRNPAAAQSRRPVYYEFNGNRLARNPATNFLSYLDPYATDTPKPYLYFSAGKSSNSYQADCPTYFHNGATPPVPLPPYLDVNGRFMRPDRFQIICAGLDGEFGTTNQLNAAGRTTDLLAEDNLTNFKPGLLGSGR